MSCTQVSQHQANLEHPHSGMQHIAWQRNTDLAHTLALGLMQSGGICSPTLEAARERAEVKESAELAERKLPSLCARSGSSFSDSCAM